MPAWNFGSVLTGTAMSLKSKLRKNNSFPSRLQLGSAPPVVSAAPERYALSFQPGGRVNVRADCNRGGASYEVNGAQMNFGAIALTRMGCPPGSQDTDFLRTLTQVAGYAVVQGELVLTLTDGASMRFRPAQ